MKFFIQQTKHDYAYHTEAMDQVMTAGIDDVGIGVLSGLDMYRYDFAGLLMMQNIKAKFGVGPHIRSVFQESVPLTISILTIF